jgi:hypothetical protein
VLADICCVLLLLPLLLLLLLLLFCVCGMSCSAAGQHVWHSWR